MITVTADAAGRPVSVRSDEEIVVTLSENRTAGFQWAIEAVAGNLTLVSTDFEPPADDRPGAGGRRAIVLRAGAPGAGELRVRSERPWEGRSETARALTFSFVVRSA